MCRKWDYIFTDRVNTLCGSCSTLWSWFPRGTTQQSEDTPSLILVFFMPEVVIPNFAIVISDCGCPFYKKAVSLDTA